MVEEKTEKGACITFLNVTLDTVKIEARLPQDKLDWCLLLVRTNQGRSNITVCQLDSFTGLFNFACWVVAPGRAIPQKTIQPKRGLEKKTISLQDLSTKSTTPEASLLP